MIGSNRAVWAAAVATTLLASTLGMFAQNSSKHLLLALSKRDHTLSIVDAETLKVIAKAPVGEDPHEVIASDDGKTAYVSIYGGGRFHALSVIDLAAKKALPDVDTGALNGPHGLVFSGGKVWFTAEGAKSIGRYDPSTKNVDWILGTGQDRTHMLYVTKDEKHIYTTNVSSGTVTLMELVTLPPMGPPPGMMPSPGGQGGPPPPPPGGNQPRMDWEETVVAVGKGDEGFDVSPDGRELWTANAQDGTLSVIDLTGKKVVATLDAKVEGANRLKFTPDGKMVAISNLRGEDLVIYDVASRKEYKRVKIGHGASGILMDAAGNRVFVSCGPDNYVAVVDLKTLTVTSHVDVGGEPDGLAWANSVVQ
jgi:YVTN family beta-propeller protein